MFPVPPAPAAEPAPRRSAAGPWGLPELFIISQTALPALLFLPGTQPVRFYVRVASFAISLALLAWWALGNGRQTRPHPAQPWLLAFIGYAAIMILHPFTGSLAGGTAQLILYLSVIAPVFWAPAMVRNADHLSRLMTVLLVCNGVNAFVGVMQVYDPDRWMPQEMSRLVTESAFGLGAVTYRGPSGLIVRPPGLFDNPGAVAGPAMYAALLGLVYATSASAAWMRGLALGASFAGVAAIYLSQVRVSLVVLTAMLGSYVLVLAMHQRMRRAMVMGGISAAIVVATFTFAVTLGGQSIVERTLTLFEQDPISLYTAARGGQIVYAMSDLYEQPLGAGFGRWGMIAGYFGTGSLPPLWAEIQVSGWAIDGGVPLLILGIMTPFIALLDQWRMAMSDPDARVRACAAIVLAANLGTAMLIFSFTPFVTQIGVQFWFLSGALHGIASRPRV
jgi:hypothetical protein